MKMKRFSALLVALIMALSMLPAIGTSAAETTTVLDALSGEVVWSAPDVGGLYDAAVSTHWSGWSSNGNFANLRTYDNYDVLQFYSAHQTNLEATVTASDAVKNATKGADMVVIEWKHKGQSDSDCYYNFTFRDSDGNEVTTITLDKNFPVVSETHKMGFPVNYVDMALVYYKRFIPILPLQAQLTASVPSWAQTAGGPTMLT